MKAIFYKSQWSKIYTVLIAFTMLLLTHVIAHAQTYPVQVSCHVIPPVGVSLTELQYAQIPKIQASLTLIDLARPAYDVRLRITIEGQNLILRSRTVLSLPPINLKAGVPLLIDPALLIPYFDINNLDISGMDRQTFIQRGMRLPEGPYNICIEAMDYHRPGDLAVSNSACAPVMVAEYEPPLLLPPDLSNQILFDQQPPAFQQALFTWQPQHFGLFPVEYELRIYRQMPGMEQLPRNIIRTQSAPYIKVRTTTTFYALSPLDPPLLTDETYYAEVQIFPIGYPAIFRNQGISQLVTVRITPEETKTCSAPQEYTGHSITAGVALQWKTATHCDSFITERRDMSDGSLVYHKLHLDAGGELRDTVREVYSGHSYVLRTGCLCTQDTAYSDTIQINFRRPSVKIPDYACGTETEMSEPITTLLPVLKEGDTLIAADLRVLVRQASGANGIFSGKGHVEIPYFKYARVNAVFNGITVNDEHRLIAGELHVIGLGQNIISDDVVDGLNNLHHNLHDISDGLGKITGQLDSINKARDILDNNLPPWLIDSLQIIRDLLANTNDDGLRDKLQKILDELNQKKADWELMYINIVIECLNQINDENDSLNNIIVSNLDESVEKTSGYVQNIQITPDDPEPPDKDNFIGMQIEENSITLEEYARENPEEGKELMELSKAKSRYIQMIMVRKLVNEYEVEDGKLKVLLLVGLFIDLGQNIVPKIKYEFESRGWDMNKISKENAQVVSNCTKYVAEAINVVYWNIK